MTAPLLTIAIPSFNQGRFIEEALKSALAVPVEDLEVLVLDNASTDDSWERISAIADMRLRSVRHPTNLGLLSNWNAALALARGCYLKLLPSDDVLVPSGVASALAALRRNAAELALSSYGRISTEGVSLPGRGEVVGHDGLFDSQDMLRDVRALTRFVQPIAALYRVDAARQVGGFGSPPTALADFMLWTALVARGHVCAANEMTGFERVHPGQARTRTAPSASYRDLRLGLDRLTAVALRPDARASLAAWRRELASDAALSSLAALARLRGREFRQLAAEAHRFGGAWRACAGLGPAASRRLRREASGR